MALTILVISVKTKTDRYIIQWCSRELCTYIVPMVRGRLFF